MQDKLFYDSNIWIYRFLKSDDKKDNLKRLKVKELLLNTSDIVASNQVLNEITNILLIKYKLPANTVKEKLKYILDICDLFIITDIETFQAIDLKEKYNLSFYDSLIIASAINSACNILITEDMQDGLIIENKLKIINPFKGL